MEGVGRPCRWALRAPQGSGRPRPSFSVPRLCRGVHRPAAAALRSEAGGVVVGIVALPRLRWPGSWLPVFGCGDAPFFLARLRGHCIIRP
ncbi:MAG: hypothetical protein EBQ52_03240 [Synechococcaceae bacterium LLD_019]|nr:hypothetical protein [Synechococcaceae bacterium LLD_019]NDG80071.1 hypothetical protein [Synechococcaceae bacterium WB8_1B_057]